MARHARQHETTKIEFGFEGTPEQAREAYTRPRVSLDELMDRHLVSAF